MVRVRQNRAILHFLEMLFGDDRLTAGDGDENVADGRGFAHRHHAAAVHQGFQRLDRIDLGDYHASAHAARPHGHAAAAPAVAGNHEVQARHPDIGGARNAVDDAAQKILAPGVEHVHRVGAVVLRRKRVGGAQHDARAPVPRGDHEVRRFRGDMQAGRDAHPGQRLCLDKPLANGLQHRHGLESPLGAALPHLGQG